MTLLYIIALLAAAGFGAFKYFQSAARANRARLRPNEAARPVHDEHGHGGAQGQKKPRRWIYWAVGIVLVIVAVPLFGPSGSTSSDEPKDAVRTAPAQAPTLMYGEVNPAPDWTKLAIPSSDSKWDDAIIVRIPPGGTIVWMDENAVDVQCRDIKTGEWRASGTCDSGAEFVRVKARAGDATTVWYRFKAGRA